MLFKIKFLLTYLLADQLGNALAQNTSVGIYSQTDTIPWSPKAPSSVDQSTIYNNIYYLADRTNAGVRPAYTICPVMVSPTNKYTGACGISS